MGSYFAGKLGQAGIKVAVFEKKKKKNVKKELGYIHFDVWSYQQLGLPRPDITDSCLKGTFTKNWQVPLTESAKFAVPYKTDILLMNGFISWIVKWAEMSGNVRFFYEAPFISPIVNGSAVNGAVIKGIGEITAKITIDCSGRKAEVRNSLPDECNVPKLIIRPERTFSLHMEKWECEETFPAGSNTYVCFKGFANQVGRFETLVGLSTLFGIEHSRKKHGEFVKRHLEDVPHTIKAIYSGKVPYDFPPSTLVGDGFLSAGDAAFQNKPFNGEGMSSGMEAANIALPVIKEAIGNSSVTRKDLWSYNTLYFIGIGSKFAMIRGTGETLIDLTPEEFDWLFRAKFVTKKDILSIWLKYTTEKGLWSIFKSVVKGIGNIELFKKLISSFRFGLSLSSLYKKYPRDPGGLEEWEKKLNALLQKHSIMLPR